MTCPGRRPSSRGLPDLAKDPAALGVSAPFAINARDFVWAMPAIKGRRHRQGVETKVLFARVTPERCAQAAATAEALGISLGAYMDELLAREAAQLDERGRPIWWAMPVPRDQEELPLNKSA